MAYNTLFFSDTLQFYSKIWGDLNNDHDISIEDIFVFNQEWPEIDISPFTESLPHVKPAPDGKADLTDLSSFAKIWQWKYFNLAFDTTGLAARSSAITDIKAQGNDVTFKVPENAVMVEMLIGESNFYC